MTSGQYGWTVELDDSRTSRECTGNDYLLDVVGEMELAPGFPVCNVDKMATSVEQLSSRSQSTDIYGSFVVSYLVSNSLSLQSYFLAGSKKCTVSCTLHSFSRPFIVNIVCNGNEKNSQMG